MTNVSAKQLLVREYAEGVPAALTAVATTAGAWPWEPSGSEENLDVPELGSEGLLRLSVALSRKQYGVGFFDLRDTNFDPMGDEEEDRYQHVLRDILRANNTDLAMRRADELLRTDGLVVHSIKLVLPGGGRIELTRDGQILTEDSIPWEALLLDLAAGLGPGH